MPRLSHSHMAIKGNKRNRSVHTDEAQKIQLQVISSHVDLLKLRKSTDDDVMMTSVA